MKKLLFYILPCIGLMLAGCATPPPPLHSAQGFRPEKMDTVFVMPVVDARVDKTLSLNSTKLQRWLVKSFKDKRYRTDAVTDLNSVSGITGEDIRDASPDWIKSFGPADARWLVVLEVDELSRKITFGSTGQAEVVLAILDKQTGTVVWRDKALGRLGQGGLLGMMMVSMMDEGALEEAVNQLMSRFPKHAKG